MFHRMVGDREMLHRMVGDREMLHRMVGDREMHRIAQNGGGQGNVGQLPIPHF